MSQLRTHSPVSSHKMMMVGQENSRNERELEKELCKLERERIVRLRELNKETKLFRCGSARSVSPGQRSPSPSPRSKNVSPSSPTKNRSLGAIECIYKPGPKTASPKSPSPNTSPTRNSARPGMRRSVSYGQQENGSSKLPSIHNGNQNSPKSPRTPSPKHVYHKAISVDISDFSPASSPHSSPEAHKRLLSKRNTPSEKKEQVTSVTSTTVTLIHNPDDDNIRPRSGSIFAAVDNRFNQNCLLKGPSPPPTKISAIPQIVISSEPTAQIIQSDSIENNTESKKEAEQMPLGNDTQNMVLSVPIRRGRSCSVPSVPPPSAYLQSIARRGSVSSNSEDESENTQVRMRQRSRSICVPNFSHLTNTPRGDSLMKKYTARRGSYRRTSLTIQELISDLSRGIYHTDINPVDPRYKPISDEEWRKLKQCRYLRMPSKEEKEKDNSLDVQEIFS